MALTVTHVNTTPGPSNKVDADDWTAGHTISGSELTGANGGVGASGGSVQLAGGSANADESQGASLAVGGADEDAGGPVQVSGGNGGAGLRGGSLILTAGGGDGGNDTGASITVGGGTGTGASGNIEFVTGGLTFAVLGVSSTNPQDGLPAAEGSLLVRNSGASHELWQKVNSNDTGWQRFAAAEGAPGDTGNAGSDVTIAGGNGDAGATSGAAITLQGGQAAAEGTIELYTGGLSFSILGGTADPSAGGGVAANVASLYARDNSSTGELWVKTGATDTAWTKVV